MRYPIHPIRILFSLPVLVADQACRIYRDAAARHGLGDLPAVAHWIGTWVWVWLHRWPKSQQRNT